MNEISGNPSGRLIIGERFCFREFRNTLLDAVFHHRGCSPYFFNIL